MSFSSLMLICLKERLHALFVARTYLERRDPFWVRPRSLWDPIQVLFSLFVIWFFQLGGSAGHESCSCLSRFTERVLSPRSSSSSPHSAASLRVFVVSSVQSVFVTTCARGQVSALADHVLSCASRCFLVCRLFSLARAGVHRRSDCPLATSLFSCSCIVGVWWNSHEVLRSLLSDFGLSICVSILFLNRQIKGSRFTSRNCTLIMVFWTYPKVVRWIVCDDINWFLVRFLSSVSHVFLPSLIHDFIAVSNPVPRADSLSIVMRSWRS
jgi:hypothetical protein